MSKPYYGPTNETSTTIFLEQTFVAGDFVCGTGYGIQLVLFYNCVVYLWKTRRTRRHSLFLLSYITLLLSISTLYMVAQARTVQDMYIDNRNYPGGPWQYFLDTQYLWENVAFYATLFVLTFLSDLLVLWRCWVIWTSAGRLTAFAVVAFPALMILASFVLGTLWTLQSSQPGLSLYSALPQAYGTSYYAVSLSINIILTILIVIRLLLYRREIRSLLPEEPAWHYVSLSAIIVESAALYSFLALIFIISYATGNPINQIFLGGASSAQQIATYLIIIRLAEGRAWTKDTVVKHATTLPTMGFVAKHDLDAKKRAQISTFQACDPSYLSTTNPGADSTYEFTLGGSPVENYEGIWHRDKPKHSS